MTTDPALPVWLSRVGVFDRVVTAHVGVLDARGRQVAARSWLADPGIPIPEGATAVHGISTERARREGRPPHEVIAEVVAALRALLDQGVPVVAYNASYDFSLLSAEAQRYGIAPSSTRPRSSTRS